MVGITNGSDTIFGVLAYHDGDVYSIGQIGFKPENISEVRKIEVIEDRNIVRGIIVLK